jgi:penicillin-binding protein 1A
MRRPFGRWQEIERVNDAGRGVDLSKLRDRVAKDHVALLLDQRSRLTLTAAVSLGAGLAILAVIATWFWIYWGLPRVPDAASLWSANRQPGITFLDSRGREIGVRGAYHGRRVALSDLPVYVPQAFLAIEDRRFFEHGGVDRLAIVRAVWVNLSAGRTVQGGSTISQQLARNLFLTPAQTLNRKLREMVLASRIERRLSKDEILELYLNRVFLGERAYGVDAAAHRFFGKLPQELTLAEAAILAGLPKAPSRSTPTENLDNAKARQRVVLDAMVAAGFITPRQRDAAAAERIKVAEPSGVEASLGYVFDLAAEEAQRLVGDKSGDMVIQLSIDPAIQAAAARAVRVRLGNRAVGRRPLQAALVLLDGAGGVRAMVGGTNYRATKFNRAVQAQRQPGSSFKAFVYAAAIERGLDPEEVRYDEPVEFDGWHPRNYDPGYRGAVTVRTAFALSINTVAAQVTSEIGPRAVADLASRFGIRSMPDRNTFVPHSIALGAVETNVWDMAQAFAVFMNEGKRTDAFIVERIENASGDTLYERRVTAPREVYPADLAHTMTSLLGAVVLRGTGRGAQLQGRDVVGKTGTSQDWRDAWFVGYTADYTASVWVGHDDRSPMNRITGGSIPVEIFVDTMRAAHANLPPRPLPGIEQPSYTRRDLEDASFFRSLANALRASSIINDLRPIDPYDYYER